MAFFRLQGGVDKSFDIPLRQTLVAAYGVPATVMAQLDTPIAMRLWFPADLKSCDGDPPVVRRVEAWLRSSDMTIKLLE